MASKGGAIVIGLKEKREEAGLTQQELADKVGVVRQTISNIECGLSRPSVETAQRIGKVISVNWVEFFES